MFDVQKQHTQRYVWVQEMIYIPPHTHLLAVWLSQWRGRMDWGRKKQFIHGSVWACVYTDFVAMWEETERQVTIQYLGTTCLNMQLSTKTAFSYLLRGVTSGWVKCSNTCRLPLMCTNTHIPVYMPHIIWLVYLFLCGVGKTGANNEAKHVKSGPRKRQQTTYRSVTKRSSVNSMNWLLEGGVTALPVQNLK